MNIIVKKPRVPSWIRLTILAIPLAIFGYLITVNFLIDQEFNYFYDIGGEEDTAKPYLGPLNRTSEIYHGEQNYRNINNRLIYFTIPIGKGVTFLDSTIKLTWDINGSLLIGLKNSTGWNYTWAPLILSTTNQKGWNIARQSVNLENIYVENGKLSIALDLPPSAISQNKNISIDWINITVYKPGVWK